MSASAVSGPAEAIAIVGIGCRFPGDVEGPADFWRLLSEGRDAVGEVPADRFDLAHYYDERPATPGRVMSRFGGYLKQLDQFDALFFGISPREAERLDPQQRLLLETAWEALEDAGHDPSRLDGSATGVYIGQWLSDFESRLYADPEMVDFQMTTGSGRYAASGRLSYALGLRGPSLTLDTACSSSLAAVHLAVRSLRGGECSLALAGGVNVILQPHISVAYSQSRMMAPDGRCKFGDAGGDGYVRSEGAALVVLKPLNLALADGDRIYALIRGGAINNDGRSSGSIGTPSRVGQEELLLSAYRDAGVCPGEVGYVEAHGTGTRAGDPVELGALGAVLTQGRAPGHRARVGSVKTNIGHTEGAAGVAGLVKVALALHHGTIPPSLHCRVLNPAIAWADAPYEIARDAAPWPASGGRRFAGVSAFGIAGTNAHIVLEQAPAALVPPDVDPADEPAASLLVLSAATPAALAALALRCADQLGATPSPRLRDYCWSAATRRAALPWRTALVATDAAAMAQACREHASGAGATPVQAARSRSGLVFVVPGQGAQWTGMARELIAREPVFRAAIERCDVAARPWWSNSIVEQLMLDPGARGYRLDQIDVVQPVLVALAIAYADLWRSWGVVPDAVVGHSMGEVGAACIAGVLDLDQAMRIICRRSALMRRTSGQGAMALVELSMDEAARRIRGREARIAVAVSNSPRSSVVSGDPDTVRELMTELEGEQVFCRLVNVDVASHSPQMQAPAQALENELAGLAPRAASVPIHSTVRAHRLEGQEFDAAYWSDNLRRPVRFAETVRGLLDEGMTRFVELGPHPVLLPAIQQTAQAAGVAVSTIACGRRDEPEVVNLLVAAGALWAHGQAIDWRQLMPVGGVHVSLPPYPWQRERHWIDLADAAAIGGSQRRVQGTAAPTHALLGSALELGGERPGFVWTPDLHLGRAPHLGEHRLLGTAVLPASVILELALAAARALDPAASFLEGLTFERPVVVDAQAATPLQMRASPDGDAMVLDWYGGGSAGWTRHARARLMPAGETLPAVPPLAAVGSAIDGGALYATLEQRGATFGPALRGIARAWVGTGQAVAELTRPAGDASAALRLELPAWALDACFQLAVACAAQAEVGSLPLPASLARVERWTGGGIPARVEVQIREAQGGASSCDVLLRGADGPLLRIEGMQLQRLESARARDPSEWLFEPVWATAAAATADPAVQSFVLVADAGGVGAALAHALRGEGAEVRLLAPATARAPGRIANELALAAQARPGAAVGVALMSGLQLDSLTADAESACDDMAHALREIAAFDAAPRRCWLITQGARAVRAEGGATLRLAQASLWGLASAAASEHASFWRGALDLDPRVTPAAQVAWLQSELRGATPRDAAARDGAVFVPRLRPLDRVRGRGVSALRPDATYLVTGGLGGVGLEVARWLVSRGARRLAILGRSVVPARQEWGQLDPASRSGRAAAALRELEALGAGVHYAAVDVADATALGRFLDEYRAALWPPIRGVVHAAGVIDDRLLADLDAASLRDVFAAKVHGAWHLHCLLPDLDHFVLCSSVAALIAQPGQGSYAAANAFLDALALQRHASGQPALSVNWGVWQGLGFAATAGGAQALAKLERQGMAGFAPGDGLTALGALLAAGCPHAAVLPLDHAVLHEARTSGALTGAAADLLADLDTGHSAPAAAAPAEASLVERLRADDPHRRRLHLEDHLARLAASILHLSSQRLDRSTPLGSYGLSSLMALELRNRIELDLELPLSATVLWNYPTVATLADHLLSRLVPADSLEAPPPAPADAPAPPELASAVSRIEAMSDDAALAALAGARPRGGRAR